MKSNKKARLRKAGWKTGTAQELLNLSAEDMALIALKRSLVRMVRETRQANHVTQTVLAKLLESSQSRVAKIEGASADISLDLIIRALFALGITPRKLGKFLSSS